jgi:hypothetical protein
MEIQPTRVIERIEGKGEVSDRSTWPPGPWDNEPDLVEWRDAHTGYPCLVVRGPVGALCGYVGVPPGHPAHGKDYDDVPLGDGYPHGGLTYSRACAGDVCHVPLPGEPDEVWWLGFDCAHSRDVCPGLLFIGGRVRPIFPGEVYKPIRYVQGECTELAAQLKALETPSAA